MAGGSNTFGGTIKLQGESEYRRALAQINQSLKETSSVMKTVTSAYDQNDNSTKKLKEQITVLNKQLGDQKSKLELMNTQYSKMAKAVSESANKHSELVSSYEKEKSKLEALKSSVGTTSSEYQKQEKIVDSLGKEVEESTKAQEDNEKAMSKMRVQINNAQTDINKTEKEIEGLNKEMKESPSFASKMGEGLKKAGDVALTACKGIAVSLTAITTGLVAVVTASVKARGELEQQIGGVETLFKDASDTVIANANRAYMTSGLSANEYMKQATSFSASLLQSLSGDTQKAAEIADMAMIDMSDNANKMGTDMSSITNAYQGFAKQNYTMLDNLKLGYGGTKKEMERLLQDAEKISGIHYDISNLSDVYSAIHVIQGELGITGTTAKEAQETLTGSISMVKASWDNFLSGSGDLGQLVESARYAVTNVIRLVKDALPEIINQVVQFLPELISLAGEIVDSLVSGITTYLPQLLESASTILSTLVDGITTALPQLVPVAVQMIGEIVTTLLENLPKILEMGVQVIVNLANGIASMLPDLIPTIIDVVVTLVETLIDNLDLILDAGIELIMSLAEGIVKALPRLIAKIPEIIEKLLQAIVKLLPKILEAGVNLILELVKGLIQAIPEVVKAIPKIIQSLLEAIVDLLPKLLESGINIILELVKGLLEAIPELVKAIPQIITSLITTIVKLLPKILEAGIKIIVELAKGLIQAIPQIVKVIPQIVTSIVSAFGGLLGSFKEVGGNIVKGLWDGIKNVQEWLFNKIKGFKDAVLNKFKSFFGIHSPSTLFRDQIGENLALGIGEGFTEQMDSVTKEMQNAIPTDFSVGINANPNVTLGNTSSSVKTSQDETKYSYIKEAVKDAMKEFVGIVELDKEKCGDFVIKKVTEEVYG